MSSCSMPSAQSVSSSQHISQKFIQEIETKLASPLTALATKQISLDAVLECDRSSPEAALVSMTKHEVRRIRRDCSTLSLGEKKVIDSCRCIMQFISENQREINKLRVLRREDNSSYQAALASCSPLSSEAINFLTNAPGDVNDCYDRYKDILEEVLHELNDLNSASKSDKIASDGSDVNKPIELSLSELSLNRKKPSGPINQDLFLSFLLYRPEKILTSYKDMFRARPEDRIQMLLILISKYKLSELETFVLMKKMKAYELREKEVLTDEEKQNVQFNDYYSKIVYRKGMPFLIEEQQLAGAVSNPKYVPILDYYELEDVHPHVRMSQAFLGRVSADMLERAQQLRTREIWSRCAQL